jgi:hypothetical protein
LFPFKICFSYFFMFIGLSTHPLNEQSQCICPCRRRSP